MAGVERVTPQMLRLLEVLVADLDTEWWGLALAKVAGIRSPTVYRSLARLEAARWVTSTTEKTAPSSGAKPRRRLYRLTADGVDEAERLLAREGKAAKHTSSAGQRQFGYGGATDNQPRNSAPIMAATARSAPAYRRAASLEPSKQQRPMERSARHEHRIAER
jgi:DNA-binding MarR family transcriptional regulator